MSQSANILSTYFTGNGDSIIQTDHFLNTFWEEKFDTHNINNISGTKKFSKIKHSYFLKKQIFEKCSVCNFCERWGEAWHVVFWRRSELGMWKGGGGVGERGGWGHEGGGVVGRLLGERGRRRSSHMALLHPNCLQTRTMHFSTFWVFQNQICFSTSTKFVV